MTHRLRIFFLAQDTRPDVPILKQRLLNSFPDFGDDMLKTAGIGEFAAAWRVTATTQPANYETALQLVAKHGWAFQQHTLSLAEDQFTTATFEKVNAVTPIKDLHWSIGHVPKIDKPTLDRLKAIGAGVAVHGWLYLGGTPQNGGPPFRTIVDSGIHVGAGSDAAAVSVFDPWLEIYYMVTGKNSAGELINPGQQLTRLEALRLYTAENGWYTHEENKIGTIEVGKLADLAVLNDDYLDPTKVSDEAIKKLNSVLTVVDGKVVYDATKLVLSRAKLSPVIRERRVQIVQAQAELLGFDHKLLQFVPEQIAPLGRTGHRRSRHYCSNARFNFQQPLIGQMDDDFVRCVGIDLEGFTQRTNRRKRIARPHLARDHGLFSGIDYLFTDRYARPKDQAERYHMCTITDNTAVR